MVTTALRMFAVTLTLFAATTASAAVLQVANNGTDDGGCGTKTAPCRSISRAIDSAANGDVIVVGPGRYGDLDRDGILGEANEESAGTGAIVLVDKTVTIESSGGAAATIIDAGDLSLPVVRIIANGARLGRAKKGFTLFASGSPGVSVEGSADGVAAEGNLAVLTSTGFSAVSTGAVLFQGNVASGNGTGFTVASGGGTTARANLAVASAGSGFAAGGAGTQRLEGNVALANGDFGFTAGLHDEVVITGGLAIGNRQGIFAGSGDVVTVTGLALIANVEAGVHNQNTAAMTITASNVIGNGAKGLGGSFNCGTLNESQPLGAATVFWGAATGPGDDPADDVCDVGLGVTTVVPAAPKPFKVKTKVPTF